MAHNHNPKRITQFDVARQADVSRSMVSYVINNTPGKVSDEARNRVLAAIKELGYRPNKHAQMLSSTDETIAEKAIGIILAGKYMFKRPYYGEMLATIHERVHERGWHIRFIRIFEDFSNPALFNELIHANEISGVILLGLEQVLFTADDRGLIEEIVQRVERVVCVDWEWPGVPSVRFDHKSVAYQATQHLLACNKLNIAYIGPVDGRIHGYKQALIEKGITPDDNMDYFANDPKLGYEQCIKLIQTGRPVDAILAGTDEVAISILRCLHEHGLHIPDDIAIASIDNIEIAAYMVPSLTTMDVPKREIGSHAVDILMSDRPQRGSSAFAMVVPTQLIVRESSTAQYVSDLTY